MHPDKIDQLQRLGQLHRAGTVTDEEFDALKAKILAQPDVEPPTGSPSPSDVTPGGPSGAPAPQLPQYQLLTPRAPLPPGMGVRVYPVPLGEFTESTVPAQWAADPTGRHQWRWWGGMDWTDEVADDGVRSVDPLDP